MIDKFDLDEQIRKCLTTASIKENIPEVSNELIQLAEWLTELKVRRMIQMAPMYSIQPPMGGGWPPAQ